MKNINNSYLIFLLFILLIPSLLFSQTEGESIKYNKEKDLIYQIETALKKKEYEKVEILTKELNEYRRVKNYKDSKLNKKGLVLDRFLGIASIDLIDKTKSTNYSALSTSIRLGYKIYFGKKNKFNIGMQIVGFRTNFNIGSKLQVFLPNISVANIGLINAFDFGNNKGIEFNLNGGLNLNFANEIQIGLDINPNIQFKYKKFYYGLDYSSILSFSSKPHLNIHTFSMVLGGKF